MVNNNNITDLREDGREEGEQVYPGAGAQGFIHTRLNLKLHQPMFNPNHNGNGNLLGLDHMYTFSNINAV